VYGGPLEIVVGCPTTSSATVGFSKCITKGPLVPFNTVKGVRLVYDDKGAIRWSWTTSGEDPNMSEWIIQGPPPWVHDGTMSLQFTIGGERHEIRATMLFEVDDEIEIID
jgi:hypothetical protein